MNVAVTLVTSDGAVSTCIPLPQNAVADGEIVNEAGDALTLYAIVAGVPQPFEYVIVRPPADTLFTTPVLLPTVATPVLLLLQVPPPVALLNVEPEPLHTVVVPVIVAGLALTVTNNVAGVLHPFE